MSLFLGWIIFLINLSSLMANISNNPHVIFIYADDLGWNDISYHGSDQIPTPNIDSMAMNGIILNNYYGEWLCTPSRASLMTGKYPMRLGLQHSVILATQPSGLPLNETIMPQYFKQYGYETHMVGKWHLGFQKKEYTPFYRGFDSFFGYWNGMIDYYDHTYYEDECNLGQNLFGLDLHDGMTPVLDKQGQYATHMFTERAEEIIQKHDPSKPMFMYFSHLAAHGGNSYQLSQCPGDVAEQFMYIDDPNRRIHACVVSEMDRSVGRVVNALHEKGMLENSVIMFVADNGAELDPTHGYGSNYPLRGNKWTYWEGGIRVPAYMWSPRFNLSEPRVSHQFMHVSDWLPTVVSMLGEDVDELGTIDGFDMFQALLDDTPSPRTELLQNLDPISGTSAYRKGDLKLVNGTTPSDYIYWYGSSNFEQFKDTTTYEWVFKNGSIVRDILKEMDLWIVDDPNEVYKELTLTCGKRPQKESLKCNPSLKPCLFNITADPCEYVDIADQQPEAVNEIWKTILEYKQEEMQPQAAACQVSGNPMCHHFQYVPWNDPDYYRKCSSMAPSEVRKPRSKRSRPESSAPHLYS